MATIQDIFDWLNQGAQGDIPGTGGAGANSPSGSAQLTPGQQDPQPMPGQQDPQPTPGQAMPAQPSPQDFTGGLEPGMLNQYNALVQAGVPPGLAHMILTSDQQQPGQPQTGQPQQGQQDKEKKPQGLQGSPGYQAGHEAGMGLDQLFFGKPQQQSQQSGQQAQTQPGLFDWLGSWFNSPQSDWSQ